MNLPLPSNRMDRIKLKESTIQSSILNVSLPTCKNLRNALVYKLKFILCKMVDKNEICNLRNSFPYKIYSCDCLIYCSKCCRH